ncbi:MAG: DUF3142 domain-containing protein [Proteobacteria bacterium]|nr:DUF3142 domain-containing protein [Pseudomonadota bacterium]
MNLRAIAVSCCIPLSLCACSPSGGPSSPAGEPAPRNQTVIAPAAPLAGPKTVATIGLSESVYIWQRMWLPANIVALADSRGLFSELRVLAAQDQPGEGWVEARVDLPSLKADGRPVRPVIRLDGRLPTLDADVVAGKAVAIATQWRAGGVAVDGVELDYDCAASRLGDYAKLIAAVKTKLPQGVALSITVLPSWLDSPGLADVLAQADEAVLQVHAVTDPKHGLFDPKQAQAWIEKFSQVDGKPFRVALPAYGSALVVDAQGRTVGVESESGLPVAGQRLELFADPQAVANMVHALRDKPPAHLTGFIWFRMPLPGDRRAWPLATIAAAIAGRELHADFEAHVASSGNGAFDLSVSNTGNLEAPLPASVDVGGQGCSDADALPGYRIDHATGKLRFVRESSATLPATQSRPLGWVRCKQLTPAELHVQP